ncbi:hypothetical protein BKA66DRAFT_438462 [Pyrenochaeta sp. MPI-SDFR-AT-0127]|nr:hypothetical protein BKA66DRAFT_438462 [Pyrenochaeta sp. MPI-SDFR-AT-0127]
MVAFSSSQVPNNIIDDDTQSSVLSTLDSNAFSTTISEVLDGESISNPIVTSTRKRKRNQTALDTWKYARAPQDGEPERTSSGRKGKIWYCSFSGCQNPTQKFESTTSARYHLKQTHDTNLEVDDSKVKKARVNTLESVFKAAAQTQEKKREDREYEVLTSVINREAFKEALVRVIALHDLQFSCVEWPEFQALLMTVNYAVDEIFCGLQSHSIVP